MKNLQSFLSEAKSEKPVVFAFGRMNPPTTGHAKLVDKVHELAKKHGAHHEIVLSHSHDPEKNPLSKSDKIKHARRFFPGTNISVSSKEHPTLMHHARRLSQAGHKHLIMVAGSDRVKEYHHLLNKYNGKDFHFKKITVVSAGQRDPDAEGSEGMSASKMRAHAKAGNYHEFRKGVPAHVPEHHAKELYNDVRKSMKLHEGHALNKHTYTPAQIASKHKVSIEQIEKQLKIGIQVEKEHTTNEDLAREIALDHLNERPDYYSRLKKFVESQLKIGRVIESAKYGSGIIVSIREDSIVANMIESGKMQVITMAEAIGTVSTGAPAYYFGGVADYPNEKDNLEKGPKNEATYLGGGNDSSAGVSDSALINKLRKPDSYKTEEPMNESVKSRLFTLSEEHSIPFARLNSVYNRGVASYRGYIRPGTTPQQWGMGLVEKYIREYDEKDSVMTSLRSMPAKQLMDMHHVLHRKAYAGTSKTELLDRISNKIKNAKHFAEVSAKAGQLRADIDSGKVRLKEEGDDKSLGATGSAFNTPYYGVYDKEQPINVKENIDDIVEAHLFGTDAARRAYQEMTPGEPGYVGQDKAPSVGFDTREGEEGRGSEADRVAASGARDKVAIRTFREEAGKNGKAKKKEAKEDYLGGDYNSRLSGSARSAGGYGGSYSIPVQEDVMKWAQSERTQRMFAERYGDQAKARLEEAVKKMCSSAAPKSFSKFRKSNEEMASGSDGQEGPPVTGYAKQKLGEGFEAINEDEITFHGEEHELIERCQWDEEAEPIDEALYQGRKVPLGKPMKGDVKKSKVYVKGPSGRVVKVNFGDKNMTIKKNIPARRKSFRARHHCENPGPRTKARYWSCRAW